MAKTVVIRRQSWVERFPQRVRGDLMRMVFSLASQNHYDVVVEGQRWRGDGQPATKSPGQDGGAISDAKWAMILNLRPE